MSAFDQILKSTSAIGNNAARGNQNQNTTTNKPKKSAYDWVLGILGVVATAAPGVIAASKGNNPNGGWHNDPYGNGSGGGPNLGDGSDPNRPATSGDGQFKMPLWGRIGIGVVALGLLIWGLSKIGKGKASASPAPTPSVG